MRSMSGTGRQQESATHGRTEEELQQAEVRQVSEQERQARDAQEEARYAEERKGPSPQGEEPRAGDRDRPLRGAREGRQGAAEEVQQPEEVDAEEIDREEVEPKEIDTEEIEQPEEVEPEEEQLMR
ncbi:MAG TPA: hypothetical protein VFY85_02450 [Gemmatimonadaceae bacterium]|nr:hypothetical protein [Gemmatimonadaceae bacterium]